MYVCDVIMIKRKLNRQMKLRPTISIVVLMILAIGFCISCEKEPCPDSDGVQLYAGFYRVAESVVKDTSMTKLIVFIWENGDTTRLSSSLSTNRRMAYLPLSKTSDTSSFIFQFDSIQSDTINIYHTRTLRLLSHECGFDFFYDITRAASTNHQVDSVWVRNANVGYGEQENIKIFF